MSTIGRLESLERKHASLDEQIRQEEMRPLPDSVSISKMKAEKLRLKDEMMDLSKKESEEVLSIG